MTILLISLFALAQAPTDAPAAPPVPEAPPPGPIVVSTPWVLTTGQSLKVTIETTTEFSTPTGKESTHLVTTWLLNVTAGGELGKSPVAWTETLDSVVLDVDMAGNKLSWTSADQADPPGGAEVFPLLLGHPFSVKVGADRKATVEVPELTKASDAAAGAGLDGGMVEEALSSGRLSSTSTAVLDGLVRGTVSEAGSTEALTLTVPILGDVKLDRAVRLDPTVEGNVTTYAVRETITLPAPVRTEGFALESLSGEGTLYYWPTESRPSGRDLDLKLKIEADAGGKPIVLDGTVKSHTLVELVK